MSSGERKELAGRLTRQHDELPIQDPFISTNSAQDNTITP